MESNLLDRMLDRYQKDQTSVTVTLQNKTRIHGTIKAFDSYVIIMEGQKHGIVYRHAISCLVPHAREVQKQPPPQKTAQIKPAPRPQKSSSQRSRTAQPAAKIAASGEPRINNGMKDGLMMWMQKQKAAK